MNESDLITLLRDAPPGPAKKISVTETKRRAQIRTQRRSLIVTGTLMGTLALGLTPIWLHSGNDFDGNTAQLAAELLAIEQSLASIEAELIALQSEELDSTPGNTKDLQREMDDESTAAIVLAAAQYHQSRFPTRPSTSSRFQDVIAYFPQSKAADRASRLLIQLDPPSGAEKQKP